MNDFNAGRDITVGRDLNINNSENTVKYKSIEQCDHIELQKEKEHTIVLQKDVKKKKYLFSIKPIVFSIVMGFLAWGWSCIGFWNKEMITGFLTLLSLGGVIISYYALNQQTRTEQMLEERLNNINDLLLLRTPRK